MIDSIERHFGESEAFVKPEGRVEYFNVNCYATRCAFPLGENLLEQLRSDAPRAKFRQQGNIHDADFVLARMDVKAPGRLACNENDLKLRPWIILFVTMPLGFELMPKKLLLLRIRPIDSGQFLGPCARINPK